jgi:lipoprotein-releasing system ATP-binding protein
MADETPVIYLNGIERHYKQGDATLDILSGVELAVWAGQSVALIA